jgi:cytochrome c peroxidase
MRKQWCLFVALVLVAAVFAVDQPVDARSSDAKPALVELGRRLFMDPSMSREVKNSCADCHQPEHGFSDPRVKSAAANGPTARHSQPILNLAAATGFHWDGEFDSLRQLAVARMGTPAEALEQARSLHNSHFQRSRKHGRTPDEKEFQRRIRTLAPPYYGTSTPTTPTTTPILLRLKEDGRYDRGLRAAFGRSEVTTQHLAEAMEAYMLSIESTETPYDRFVKGKPDALTESARRGLYLFEGKARCAECHTTSKQGEYASFTDGKFHNTGVAFRGIYGAFDGKVNVDGGRGVMSFVKKDLGMFKTPTLRDVARRPPYMHDGGFKTLEEVVRYYDEGGTPNARLSEHVEPIDLTDGEVADLLAFLEEGLTSYERPGLGPIPAHRPDETVITRVTLAGKPVKGMEVEVHPYGDRFRGVPRTDKAMKLVSDKRGRVKFTFPPTTHVLLKARGFEIGLSRPIPDYVDAMTLMVTPMDQVILRVRPSDKGPVLPGILHATLMKNGAVDASNFVKLKKLRRLEDRSALYTAPASGVGVRTVVLDIRKKKKTTRLGMFEVDFKGGQTEPIDLRTQASFPTVPTFVPGTPGAPPLRGRTTSTDRGTR